MTHTRHWLHLLGGSLLATLTIATLTETAQAASLVNSIVIPGNATDLYPLNGGNGGANVNRLGGFGSDLYYDRTSNVYYGLSDRGPGGGVISYEPRLQKFSLDVDPTTGAIGNFNLLETILLQTSTGQSFNGLNPQLLNGTAATLGLSLDPEGFVLAPNGNFYVSDEYGPSVREFTPQGRLVRSFTTPANILPQAGGTPNFVDGRPTITTGRQDNRGFEGLAITPDGTKLIAMLQDPLVNEGANNDGRRSRNLRMVVFDIATGESTAQYIYPLESIATINDRLPGTADDFSATAQGRNIGISSIIAINDKEFLVLERDNRGIGSDNPTGSVPVGSKRVFKIDLTGATDVSNISLANTNTLPAGVTPVNKNTTPFIDLASALRDAGLPLPEKFEGLTIGPRLLDGSYALIVATDNDYSVTQTGSGTQFDVCSGGAQVALDSPCPTGQTLIPSFLYSFRVSEAELAGYVQPGATVPEPTTAAGFALFGMAGAWLKRRQKSKV